MEDRGGQRVTNVVVRPTRSTRRGLTLLSTLSDLGETESNWSSKTVTASRIARRADAVVGTRRARCLVPADTTLTKPHDRTGREPQAFPQPTRRRQNRGDARFHTVRDTLTRVMIRRGTEEGLWQQHPKPRIPSGHPRSPACL